MRDGAQRPIANSVLSVLPAATLVVAADGRVTYANHVAKRRLGLAEVDGSGATIGEWQPQTGALPKVLAAIAASSNWVPLRLSRDGETLHFRARGLREAGSDVAQVVLTEASDGTASFDDLSRKIWTLNEQIAIYQRTELRLRNSISLSRLLKRELVHRVKNNLAIISAILRSKARTTGNHDVSSALYDAESRIRSIAVVHDILDLSNQTDRVDLSELFDQLLEHIRSSICPDHLQVEANLTAAQAHIDIAVPLALLVNELVTNAIKHGFTGRAAGTVQVEFRAVPDAFLLQVSDDGIGMKVDAAGQVDTPRIVAAFAAQIGTTVECEVQDGTRWSAVIAAADLVGRPSMETLVSRAGAQRD